MKTLGQIGAEAYERPGSDDTVDYDEIWNDADRTWRMRWEAAALAIQSEIKRRNGECPDGHQALVNQAPKTGLGPAGFDPVSQAGRDDRHTLRSIQRRVERWGDECFGHVINHDPRERHLRCLEEALELAQTGLSKADALSLVDYVFGRPVGDAQQEIGGLTTSLAALCYAIDHDWQACAMAELFRIEGLVEEISAKRNGKPKHLRGNACDRDRHPEGEDALAASVAKPLEPGPKGSPKYSPEYLAIQLEVIERVAKELDEVAASLPRTHSHKPQWRAAAGLVRSLIPSAEQS